VDGSVDCKSLTDDPRLGPHIPKALVAAWRKLPDSIKDRWVWWRFEPPMRRRSPPVERLIDLEPSGVEWNTEEETNRLIGMMSEVNRSKVDQAIQSGKFRVGFLYKRMREGRQRAEVRFDGVAGCLRTPGGGSSRQTLLVIRGKQIRSRLLSPREAARLMGLPDEFELPGTYNEAYKAMGDGVACSVVKALDEQLLAPMAGAVSRGFARARNRAQEGHSRFRASAESRAAKWTTPARL
jgi:DNA (cytosine-5)-methyltransferase 1